MCPAARRPPTTPDPNPAARTPLRIPFVALKSVTDIIDGGEPTRLECATARSRFGAPNPKARNIGLTSYTANRRAWSSRPAQWTCFCLRVCARARAALPRRPASV